MQQGITKAKSLTITELRQNKDRTTRKSQTLPLVITHNPTSSFYANRQR